MPTSDMYKAAAHAFHYGGRFDRVYIDQALGARPSKDHYQDMLRRSSINKLKEPTVTKPFEIKTTTCINGTDAKHLSDDQIFKIIADLESQIDQLNKVQHKPKKLLDKIDALRADIASIIKYVDEREA